jgi:hypothetical protein
MPILFALIVAFGFVLYFNRKHAPTRGFRWRADKTGDRGVLRKYNCVACGAEAFTSTKGPPNDCRAKTKTPSL